MSYDKTVGGIHKIYKATGTGSFSSVYDLLSSDAKSEVNDLLTNSGTHQYYSHDPLYSNKENVKRLIVDGYLRYTNGQLIVAHSDNPGSDIEVLQEDEIYPVPVINWIFDTYINVANGEEVVVRIFFS